MMSRMNEVEQLKKEEGFKAHVYKCSEGFNTCGYGYNLDANPLNLTDFEISEIKSKGISEPTANYLLHRYIEEIEKTLQIKVEGFEHLDADRRGVLIMMAYQMGVSGLLKFRKMLVAVKHDEYRLAASEMLDSAWAKQTPARAKRMAQQMRYGMES